MAKKKQDVSAEKMLEHALVPEDEQAYTVPNNWIWARLGLMAEYIQRGKSPKYSDIQRYPVISQKCIQWSGFDTNVIKFIDPDSINSYGSERFIQIGDILWNSTGTGTIGRLNIYSGELENYEVIVVDSHVTVVRVQKIYNKFVFYYLCNPRIQDDIESRATGTTNQIELNSNTVINLPIPLPPLPEQQRIVDRIETLFEKLDKAKELIQDALDSFENRKAAILHKAFTGELTKKWREENGVGMESWEEKPLSECTRKVTDGFHSSPKPVEHGYPYVMAGHVKPDRIDYYNGLYMDEKNHQELFKKAFPQKGDILLVNIGAGTGTPAVIDVDFQFSFKNCAIIKLLEAYDSRFVFYYLLSIQRKILIEITRGGAQPFLSLKLINSIKIPIPSYLEQKEIVRILDKFLEKEQSAAEISEIIDRIDLIKKSILARAFRGELGTNNPAEESAVELLKELMIS